MRQRRLFRAARKPDQALAAVIEAFMQSPKWAAYSWATQDSWGRELRLICRPPLGALSVRVVRPSIIQAHLEGMAGLPGKQEAALSALKQFEKWAIVRDLLPGLITTGVERERSKNGRRPWTEEQVQLAEVHARFELSKAVTLAGNTGQRGSDLVRMCWTDIEVYNGRAGINVTQQKTGRRLWVPITQELDAAMAQWERQPGPILRSPTGGAWRRKQLTDAWGSERDGNPALAALAGLTLHGLRATACVRLLRVGANTRQISDMVGMSEPMVARYTRFSVQRENASAAVLLLDRTFMERKRESGK